MARHGERRTGGGTPAGDGRPEPPASGKTGSAGGPGGALRRALPLLGLLALLAGAYVFGLHRHLSLEQLGESRDALRALVTAHALLAPLAFVALYALAVACSFPAAAVLTITGGFLFGWFWGGVLSVVGATSGATLLFLAARSASGAGLRQRAERWAGAWGESFRDNAFSTLLVLRLVPFIPFFVINIIPAVFGVGTRVFVAATGLGVIPGALINAWLGQGLDQAVLAAQAAGRPPGLSDLVTPEITVALMGLAGLAVAAAAVRRLWRRRSPA